MYPLCDKDHRAFIIAAAGSPVVSWGLHFDMGRGLDAVTLWRVSPRCCLKVACFPVSEGARYR